jgi:hypothetical protein
VLEYLVDVAADEDNSRDDVGAVGDMLLQYVPGLSNDNDNDHDCDENPSNDKVRATPLLSAIALIKSLAQAKRLDEQQRSAEARRTSTSQAGQVYTAILGEIEKVVDRDREAGQAERPPWFYFKERESEHDRVKAVLAKLIDHENNQTSDSASTCVGAKKMFDFLSDDQGHTVIAFVLSELCHSNVLEGCSYFRANCCNQEGRERLLGLMDRATRQWSEEEQRKREAVRTVVERFEDVEVRPKYDAKGQLLEGRVKKDLVIFMDKAPSDGKHIRYRDGVPVVHNGAKFIVEKDPKEDYDGGSRGKVKSKGKRGKGWV